ncbi:MAG: hypothetical protein ACE5IQ_14615 [Candidatus Methylomirabilales bacterium]
MRHPGSTEIIPWPSRELPGILDALILPEDTYLVLQAVTEELDPNVTPLDLWAAVERAATAEKYPLGSVVITDGRARGVKYVAWVIVYDFEDDPICQREIVLASLRDALGELTTRGCGAIGVFPLGTMCGGISQEEYFTAVNEVVTRSGSVFPQTLYLLGPHPAPGVNPDP